MNPLKNKYIIIIITILLITCLLLLWYSKKKKQDNMQSFNYIKYADDVTNMNKTIVDNVFEVLSTEDIIYVIELARKYNKKVVARGERHSMGGHTIAKDGYIIDTKYMNNILDIDILNRTVTVEPGVTWYSLIYFLNSYGLSPKILQSYASFSVGGSVSVNIHGITSDYGLHKSIIELEIVNYEGNLITCNRELNSDLFYLVIGGYGLFGIITKIKLSIEGNYDLDMNVIATDIYKFQDNYSKYINNMDSNNVNVKIARINIVNMTDISLYVFTKKSNTKIISKLNDIPKEMSKVTQLLYKWMLPNEKVQKARFKLEQIMGKPLDINNNVINRNELLYESAKPLAILYSPIIDINKTHILQEYFIPSNNQNSFIIFMKYLKEIFVGNNNKNKNINLLNITIRYVMSDNETLLNYAKKDMYAFVFYYRIDCSKEADKKLQYIHNLLVNKTLELGGTFYLPYRHHYTYDQLQTAYPNIDRFFALKRKYDPDEMFINLWYLNYSQFSSKNNNNISEIQLIKHKYESEHINKPLISQIFFKNILESEVNRK